MTDRIFGIWTKHRKSDVLYSANLFFFITSHSITLHLQHSSTESSLCYHLLKFFNTLHEHKLEMPFRQTHSLSVQAAVIMNHLSRSNILIIRMDAHVFTAKKHARLDKLVIVKTTFLSISIEHNSNMRKTVNLHSAHATQGIHTKSIINTAGSSLLKSCLVY